MQVIQTVDLSVLRWIQQAMKCDLLDFLMPKITFLGNGGMVWIVIAVAFLVMRKYRPCGIRMLTGLLAGLLTGNVFLKNVVARSRPCWIDSTVTLLISNPVDYSFPSGHALSSFVAATILFRADKRIGIPALALATVISFSRLYLYVHFLTDVVAGALLGITIGIITDRLLSRIIRFYERRSTNTSA